VTAHILQLSSNPQRQTVVCKLLSAHLDIKHLSRRYDRTNNNQLPLAFNLTERAGLEITEC
jgi:hypothetical protein